MSRQLRGSQNRINRQSCVEIKIVDLELDDQIIIIATDGIWQYMSNTNVASIAQAHFEQGAAEAAANAIVRRAAQLWRDVSVLYLIYNLFSITKTTWMT